MAIVEEKYLCFLVDQMLQQPTMGVVRESDTLLHVHTFREEKNCNGKSILVIWGEKTIKKETLRMDDMIIAWDIREAQREFFGLINQRNQLQKLLTDD